MLGRVNLHECVCQPIRRPVPSPVIRSLELSDGQMDLAQRARNHFTVTATYILFDGGGQNAVVLSCPYGPTNKLMHGNG
ncbi:hypothetical protein D3C78_1740300 [compost metagenome]